MDEKEAAVTYPALHSCKIIERARKLSWSTWEFQTQFERLWGGTSGTNTERYRIMTVYSHFQEKPLIYIFDLARVFPHRSRSSWQNKQRKQTELWSRSSLNPRTWDSKHRSEFFEIMDRREQKVIFIRFRPSRSTWTYRGARHSRSHSIPRTAFLCTWPRKLNVT